MTSMFQDQGTSNYVDIEARRKNMLCILGLATSGSCNMFAGVL